MHFLRRYRDIIVSIVLLTVPFFFLNANLKDPDDLNPMDRVILQVSAPIQWVGAAAAEGASNLWDRYVYLFDTRAENDRRQQQDGASHTHLLGVHRGCNSTAGAARPLNDPGRCFLTS